MKRGKLPAHAREIALITRATRGIGLELTRLCVEAGYRTVLVARELGNA